MRSAKRTIGRLSGVLVSVFLFTLAFVAIGPKFPNFKFNNTAAAPVVAPAVVEETTSSLETLPTVTQATSQSPAVLAVGAGSMWWPLKNLTCMGGNGLVNNCDLPKAGNTVKLQEVFMQKGHRGLQIPDGFSTKDTVKECVDSYGSPIGCGKKGAIVVFEETFEYCDASMGEVEDLAMMNMSPISYPKMFESQATSSRRVLDDLYAKIDYKEFQKLSPEEIADLVCQLPSAGDRRLSDAFRTVNTYNSTFMGTGGINLADAALVLCQLSPGGEARKELAKQLFEKYDSGVESVSIHLKLENNNFADKVETRFRDGMIQQGLAGVAPSGMPFVGAWVWQPKSVKNFNVLDVNVYGASALMTDWITPPQYTIANLAKNMGTAEDIVDYQINTSESKTLLSGGAIQLEDEYTTIKDALLGRVYYMPEDVITDTENLARLTYDPVNFSDKYVCDEDPSRCPIVRAISGCKGTSNAPVDIRLRNITLSVNDTRRYATVGDKDSPRITNRAVYTYNKSIMAPRPWLDSASIDELIVASKKGTMTCTAEAVTRVEEQLQLLTPEEQKIKERDFEELEAYFEGPMPMDAVGVLATPLKIKYTSWALFDADAGVLAACKSHGGCGGIKEKGNVKQVSGTVTKPAYFSFPMAIFMTGFNEMAPNTIQYENRYEDLEVMLATQKIYPVAGYKIDCDPGMAYGEQGAYWICSDGKEIGLPKCNP